jgi:hypothetical protein
MIRVTLPGASLGYGHTDSVNKTAVCLMSLWLLFGPDIAMMRRVTRTVRCVTTDFGVEVKTVDAPDILDAWFARQCGATPDTCRGLVDSTKRLFPLSLRIYGWSHCFGNLMKYIAKSHPKWPEILDSSRGLCSFFKVQQWRDHLVDMNFGKGIDLAPLQHWTASFAKWRYETISEVFRQINLYADICGRGVRPEMFNNFQDRALLASVLKTCKDDCLFLFYSCSYEYMFAPLERARRWGMVCQCPDHVRMRKEEGVKHISCPQNGRNLRWAYREATLISQDMYNLAMSWSATVIDESTRVHKEVRDMLLRGSQELQLRTAYLGLVPWAFCRADEKEGALLVVAQVQSRSLDKHDPLTQDVWRRLENDIRIVAAGGECSEALAKEVRLINWSSLDESAGEGYHRYTNIEATRARGSKMIHLKGESRHRQNLKTNFAFIRKTVRQARLCADSSGAIGAGSCSFPRGGGGAGDSCRPRPS